MKHAILILAHKNIGQLCRLVEYFKHDCDVFIHIDRKKVITPVEKEKILGFKQVKFISQEYDVNWGENQKKVKKAKLDLNNSQLVFQKNIKLMTLEIHQAIQNVSDSYTLVQTATTGQRRADENLRVMTSRYGNGLCTFTDLLEAQSTWQQTQSNMIEAKAQYKIHQVEYLKVSGVLY